MEDALTCYVCQNPAVPAAQMDCGHLMCGACGLRWWQVTHSCPACRQVCHFTPRPCPAVDYLVSKRLKSGKCRPSQEPKQERSKSLTLRSEGSYDDVCLTRDNGRRTDVLSLATHCKPSNLEESCSAGSLVLAHMSLRIQRSGRCSQDFDVVPILRRKARAQGRPLQLSRLAIASYPEATSQSHPATATALSA